MLTTPRLSLQKPEAVGDGVDKLRLAIGDHADKLDDAQLAVSGTSTPPPGVPLREFHNTNHGDVLTDMGTYWAPKTASASVFLEESDWTTLTVGDRTTLKLGWFGAATLNGAFDRIDSLGGHAIRVNYAGRYRVSHTIEITGAEGATIEFGDDTNKTAGVGSLTPPTRRLLSTSAVVKLLANDLIRIRPIHGGGGGVGSARVHNIAVERLGSV